MRKFNGSSFVSAAFWKKFEQLSPADQKHARNSHAMWRKDTTIPGLRFKKVHSTLPIYSIRASLDIRALGVITDGDILWFWIGTHSEYEQVLKKL